MNWTLQICDNVQRSVGKRFWTSAVTSVDLNPVLGDTRAIEPGTLRPRE